MLLRIARSVSVPISRKVPPAISAREETGFNGSSPDPNLIKNYI